jgi:hypothetical protein
MRRGALRSGLVPVLGLLLTAGVLAGAQPDGDRVVRPEPTASARPPVQPVRAPREAFEPDASGTAVHAPMPVPDMPVPEGRAPASASDEGIQGPVFDLPLAPPLSSNFAGLGDNNQAIPPDTYGAVGPNHVMEMLNTQVLVQTRTGTTAYGPMLLNWSGNPSGAFWSIASPNGTGVFDPRVVYDPFADRWIVVACDEAQSPNSRLLVGVSKTAVPDLAAANWYQNAIDVDPGTTLWADYPTVGFSARWVVVQVNIFRIADGVQERSHIYVFDKTQMYAGDLSTAAYHLLDRDALADGGTQVPAVTYDVGVDDVYLLQRWNSGAGMLRLYRITGTTLANVDLVPIAFPAQGSWTDNPGDVDFAPQRAGPPGCVAACNPNCKIRTNDSRIQNVVYRNGMLWATHTVVLSAPARASVQWWQLQTDGTITQRGLVDDSTGARFFAFPSITVNKNDDVLLGYSRFQGTEYAGASYSFRTAIDPPNTMQLESPLKDGEACYYKDFASTRNRWGDYSATVVDPTDDTKMWTLQEYAAPRSGGSDRWGTWWGMLDPTPRIAITDAVVSEDAPPGTTLLAFDLSLLNSDLSQPLATSQTVTAQWATANGTATAGSDYVAGSGTVTFAPGETTKTIKVTVNGDTNVEGDETLFVNLSAPVDATLADNQGQGTILDLPLPQISIGDVTLVEGSGGAGSPTSFVFPVTLSHPSNSNVTVSWATVNGTAVAGAYGTGDFVGVGLTTLTFTPGNVTQTVTVQVHADTLVEPDEVFYVDLSSPSGATIVRSRGVGMIQDDDALYPGVIGLSILADSVGSGATDGRNRLQWVTPAAPVTAIQAYIKYNQGGSCTPPLTRATGSGPILCPVSVGRSSCPHTGLTLGQQYCYTVWLDYGGGNYSAGVSLSARPFDSTPPSKVLWKLSTGMTLMAAPTVGLDAVIAVSNDMSVQALQRDPTSGTGGLWPASWTPVELGSIAQHRLPVVPLGGGSRAFVATQDGRIHAIDTASGNLIWSTLLPEGAATGAPAGIFAAFSGPYDYVLVGTSAGSNNHFYALHPDTGAVIDVFPGPSDGAIGSVGAILGTATVDYATGRVYFASRRDAALRSLWCLELGPSSDALRLRWSRDLGFDVDGSPVLRGGRLYVVDNSAAHVAWSIPADTGLGGYSRSLGATASKGFPFPDRRNGDLYVATDSTVVGLTDTGSVLNLKWTPIGLDQPSIVLFRPGTNELYVGVRNYSGAASLLRIDVATGTVAANVALETSQQVVGAPSLDIGYGVVHVGSELGILYAVQLPF